MRQCTIPLRTLSSLGATGQNFASVQEFCSKLTDVPRCLVLDVQLRELSGLDLQKRMAEAGREIPIIFMTDHGDIPMPREQQVMGLVVAGLLNQQIAESWAPARPLTG